MLTSAAAASLYILIPPFAPAPALALLTAYIQKLLKAEFVLKVCQI